MARQVVWPARCAVCLGIYTHSHYHVIFIRYAVRYVNIVRVFVWQEGESPCHARMAFVAKAVVVGMARTSTWRRGTDTVCSAQI